MATTNSREAKKENDLKAFAGNVLGRQKVGLAKNQSKFRWRYGLIILGGCKIKCVYSIY